MFDKNGKLLHSKTHISMLIYLHNCCHKTVLQNDTDATEKQI
jgi:hypothetical protein